MHNVYIYRVLFQLESKSDLFHAVLFTIHLIRLFSEFQILPLKLKLYTILLTRTLQLSTLPSTNIPLALQYLSYPRNVGKNIFANAIYCPYYFIVRCQLYNYIHSRVKRDYFLELLFIIQLRKFSYQSCLTFVTGLIL